MAGNTILLYGKNSVFERLKANPSSIKKVFLQDNFKGPDIEGLIEKNNISLERLSFDDMDKIKSGKSFQGIIAKAAKFEYMDFEGALIKSKKDNTAIIFLDRINDPQNLGVIIRTVACFGGFTLVIPKFEACEVNETVIHVASGGENYVHVSKVSNLSSAIRSAKDKGYWIAGAMVTDDAEDINKTKFLFPIGLVLGSEGEGIRYGIEKQLDIKARIPMNGAKLSFNVNMACAVFCNEITRQRMPLK